MNLLARCCLYCTTDNEEIQYTDFVDTKVGYLITKFKGIQYQQDQIMISNIPDYDF